MLCSSLKVVFGNTSECVLTKEGEVGGSLPATCAGKNEVSCGLET